MYEIIDFEANNLKSAFKRVINAVILSNVKNTVLLYLLYLCYSVKSISISKMYPKEHFFPCSVYYLNPIKFLYSLI